MQKKEDSLSILTDNDRMKYEIAEELGLIDKVKSGGWKSLTAKESGKIGGIMNRKRLEEKKKTEEDSAKS